MNPNRTKVSNESSPVSALRFIDFAINGGKPVRGKPAITADWKKFYDSPRASFSWKPDLVEVLPSGTLAYSTGPVSNPDGVVFARFNSTWRLEAPGVWRVVFDNGSEVCNCPKP